MPTVPAWKKAETELGKIFGAPRRPLSGQNSRSGGSDDCIHPRLHLESKYAQYHPIHALYRKTREKARREGKVPVIGLREKGRKGCLLVIHEEDLMKVAKEYARARWDELYQYRGGRP